MHDSLLDIPCVTIEGEQKRLADFDAKVLLMVNTASQCGFTPQYKGLEELWQRYRARGLVVLGFPCNQFGQQEPDGEQQIAAFCERRFGVSFPLFAKVEVNGGDAHPLFIELKKRAPGLLGVPVTHALDALIFATDAPAFSETWVAGRRIQSAPQVAERFAAAMETLWT